MDSKTTTGFSAFILVALFSFFAPERAQQIVFYALWLVGVPFGLFCLYIARKS